MTRADDLEAPEDWFCPDCGHTSCGCDIDACRACGGGGTIYYEQDPDTGWQCYACDGTGVQPL